MGKLSGIGQRLRDKVGRWWLSAVAGTVGLAGLDMIGSPPLGWGLIAVSLIMFTWISLPEIIAHANPKFERGPKRLPSQPRAVPLTPVKVSLPKLAVRSRYPIAIGTTIESVDVTNPTERRQFWAHLWLLYGCWSEVPERNVTNVVHTIPWASNEGSERWLNKDETDALTVGYWCNEEGDSKTFQLFVTDDLAGMNSRQTERTSLTSENHKKLYFRITLESIPALPQQPIERLYELDWDNGLRDVTMTESDTEAPALDVTVESPKDGDQTHFVLRVQNRNLLTYEISARLSFLYGSESEIDGHLSSTLMLPVKGQGTASETVDADGVVRFLVARRQYNEFMLYFLGPGEALTDTLIKSDNERRIECEVEFLLASVGEEGAQTVGHTQRYSIGWDGVDER